MRLICPNCGAQYEVADDVIPDAGRDVQCSNCAHTWFERPGASIAAEEADESDFAEPVTVDEPDPEPDVVEIAEPDIVPEPDTVPEPVLADPDIDLPATFADVPELEPEPEPEPVAPPPPVYSPVYPPVRAPLRSTLTPNVADILREEAAREEAARRAEAPPPLETQAELPLAPPSDADLARDEDARGRIARMIAASAAVERDTPAPMPPAPVMPPMQTARRDRLPDIEEINSTLRSATERGPIAAAQIEQTEQGNKRGFRFGFGLILLIAAAFAMVYVYTPRIIVMVPEVEPILTPYADAVDAGRLWLDLQLQDLLEVIDPPESDAPVEPATGG